MMKYYKAKKGDLHMVFINMEKAYDKVPKSTLVANDKEGNS